MIDIMKSYTDIEQSKKLAEILPVESADEIWERIAIAGANLDVPEEMEYWHSGDTPYILSSKGGIPCWSLAALIEVLPLGVDIHNISDGHKIYYYVELYTKEIYMKLKRMNKPEICLSTERYENLVDACYEMILKLKERNLL